MKSFARLLVTAGFMLSVGSVSAVRADETPIPGVPTMTDGQIAQVVLVANDAEINAARAARTRARGKAVLDFAQLMLNEHGAARLQAIRLFRKLDIIPLDSTTSRHLQKTTAEQLVNLRRTHSLDFDRTYITYQIKAHQDVLDLFNRVLIPNAKGAQMKGLLAQMQPVIEKHLHLAESIQRDLGE